MQMVSGAVSFAGGHYRHSEVEQYFAVGLWSEVLETNRCFLRVGAWGVGWGGFCVSRMVVRLFI